MDQQYSMTLGRPLGISGIGDCPPPEPLTTNPTILRLSEYINTFTILARQILSSDRLTTHKIDDFTDKLLALRDTLPGIVQFDDTWNNPDKSIPDWPMDAQAAVFYGKTHNFLILLNRQRQDLDDQASSSTSSYTFSSPPGNHTPTLRGRERVLASARALLSAFEFFHTRVCAAMVCWTMGQQAFNASMLLALNMLHPSPSTTPAATLAAKDDLSRVQKAWATFREMHEKGIHKLAGVASTKIYALLEQIEAQQQQPQQQQQMGDAVMGNTGMLLLEDPGLQAFVPEPFQPLQFQMAGGDLASHVPGVDGNTNNPNAASNFGQAQQQAQPQLQQPIFHHHPPMDLNMLMGIGDDLPQTSPGWAARPVPSSLGASQADPVAGLEVPLQRPAYVPQPQLQQQQQQQQQHQQQPSLVACPVVLPDNHLQSGW